MFSDFDQLTPKSVWRKLSLSSFHCEWHWQIATDFEDPSDLAKPSENPNSGQRHKIAAATKERKVSCRPCIVMAEVWSANFGLLHPQVFPDGWRWRCFMRIIYLIAQHCPEYIVSLYQGKIQKTSMFVLLLLSQYFHWVHTILVERLSANTRQHCVKREPDARISQCLELL